jgi:flagellar hook-basal body complex protein FliE
MKEITFQHNIETLLGSPIREKQAPEEKGKSFGEILKSAIGEVNQLQKEADQAIQELAAGKGNQNIHQTMIALEKAEVSFQLMMQVRNKIIAAYEEIMRMQI